MIMARQNKKEVGRDCGNCTSIGKLPQCRINYLKRGCEHWFNKKLGKRAETRCPVCGYIEFTQKQKISKDSGRYEDLFFAFNIPFREFDMRDRHGGDTIVSFGCPNCGSVHIPREKR